MLLVAANEYPELVSIRSKEGYHPLSETYAFETNACRRLMECAYYLPYKDSLDEWSVAHTVALPPVIQAVLDGDEELQAVGRIIINVQKMVDFDDRLTAEGWTPILSEFELYGGHCERPVDHGRLVYADRTLTKFVLVIPFPIHAQLPPYTDASGNTVHPPSYLPDYDEIMRCHAQRFLNLVTYLPNMPQVEWVRASFTTVENPDVHPRLFDPSLVSSPSRRGVRPPIHHLTPNQLQPYFTDVDFHRMDTFLKTIRLEPPNEEKKALVRFSSTSLPNPNAIVLERSQENCYKPFFRHCLPCNKAFERKDVRTCSACWSGTFYCSTECQRKHWPVHKTVCMPKDKREK